MVSWQMKPAWARLFKQQRSWHIWLVKKVSMIIPVFKYLSVHGAQPTINIQQDVWEWSFDCFIGFCGFERLTFDLHFSFRELGSTSDCGADV